MQPEYTAYQNSPHARRGVREVPHRAGRFVVVKSKLSGVGQVLAVTFQPIDAPSHAVRSLRPARRRPAKACHWPQKYGEDRLQ